MPIDIKQASAQDISHLGKQLYRELRSDGNMIFEDTAQDICAALYETFQTNGDSTFALVRIFRLCKYDDLPPDVQPEKDRRSGHHWMTLAGTAGDEDEWWNRHNSQMHRAVSAEKGKAPMFTAAFEQIGLNPGTRPMPDDLQFEPGQMKMTRYFFVQDAKDHHAITDQQRFVDPYDIKSVVALGSPFLSGSSYIAIAFSKVVLSEDDAEKWTELTPYISSLLAIPDGKGAFWR
jgi:hypothetical protein